MVFCKFYWVVCFEITLSVWVIQYSEIGAAALECERGHSDGCCEGYYFNLKNANCTKCSPGFIGPNCTISCPYPSYGEECQEQCDCSNSSCDISTGCRTPITDDDTCQGHCNCSNTECADSTGSTTLPTDNNTIRNASLYTTAAPGATNSTINVILIILIQIFGGVDVFLICIHLLLFVIDYRRKNTSQRQKTTGSRFVTRNNSRYENIEIDLSNY